MASFYIGYVITHVPGGILAEKFGGKWTLSLGILSTAIFTILTPLAVEWGIFIWICHLIRCSYFKYIDFLQEVMLLWLFCVFWWVLAKEQHSLHWVFCLRHGCRWTKEVKLDHLCSAAVKYVFVLLNYYFWSIVFVSISRILFFLSELSDVKLISLKALDKNDKLFFFHFKWNWIERFHSNR